MPIYLFWGEDDFAIAKAVEQLRQAILDPNWAQLNYDKLSGDSDVVVEALNQAMTSAFGSGGRLIWLADTNLCQQCSDELVSELERTLPAIPETSTLLLTTSKKPDKRLKSTKLLQKYAQIKEFSLLPPWKTEELNKKVQETAQDVGVCLTKAAVELLAESVGNNTRQLWNELEKLRLYGYSQAEPIEADVITALVSVNTQSSLQLAAAIRNGDSSRALTLVTDLINRNEPALRIVATLVGQFRLWTIVKLMLEQGEKDEKIAQAAEVGNPKRIYFLRKEVQSLAAEHLLASLPLLLQLELVLKEGADPLSTLQTKVIELCCLFETNR